MLVFTKTCARDAERVAYQAEAVAARGWSHLVLVEDADREAVEQAIERVRSPKRVVLGRPFERLRTVEDQIPEAMTLQSPYLRQMYCKLVAPTIWGDMLQIDSDMCPYAAPDWASNVGGHSKPLWFRTSSVGTSRLEPVQAWSEGYRELLGVPAPPIGWSFDYMDPCKGWWVTRELATALLYDLHAFAGTKGVLLSNLEAVFAAGKLSEYQLLGLYANHYMPDAYIWCDGTQPAWCHHFTSAEELTPEQRRRLAEAGAL